MQPEESGRGPKARRHCPRPPRGRSGMWCSLREEEACDEAKECEHLNECHTDEHGGAELAGNLRLTRHALDRLTDQDSQTNTGAERGEAVTDGRNVAADLRESGDVHCCFLPLE